MDESSERADAMAALERQARAPMGFVAASTGPEGGNRPRPSGAGEEEPSAPVNPDAIDLDMDAD
jgi:pre-mRNA-splicing factor SYF1